MRIFFIFLFLFCSVLIAEEYLTLERAFKVALENNERIKVADMSIEQIGYDKKAVLARFFPQVTGNASYTYRDQTTFISTSKHNKEAHLKLEQKILDMELMSAYKGAGTLEKMVKNEYLFTVENIFFDISKVYFDVLKQEKLLDVNEKNLNVSKEQGRVVSKRFNDGKVPKTDLLQIQSEKSRLESVLEINKNTLAMSYEIFYTLLGTDVKYKVREIPFNDKPLELKSNTIDLALQKRYDVKMQEAAVETEFWKVKSLKGGRFPKVFLEADKAWVNPKSSFYNDYTSFAFKMEVPIFGGFGKTNEIKSAKSSLRQEELKLDHLKRDVGFQITKAKLDTNSSFASLGSLEKEVVFERENYSAISARYESGLVNNLEVMDALKRLIASEIGLVNKTYEHQVNVLNFEKQTGTFGDKFCEK